MPVNKTALFCPMLMACNVLEPRWTMMILTEMWCGSTRFNDIRRGVPGVSPTLLSRRLKELVANGLVVRVEDPAKGTIDYLRTAAAIELEPIFDALGKWAYRHTDVEDQLCWLDSKFFMWNLRRAINTDALPAHRNVIKFSYPDLDQEPRDFWLIARGGGRTDVCFVDPGYDVDLFITAELRAMVAVYFGRARWSEELSSGRISVVGSIVLERTITDWLALSSFAGSGRQLAGDNKHEVGLEVPQN